MKLLTICIPTYNRSNYLISLLEFLKNEIIPYRDLIEVRVSDNCSDESHKLVIKEYYNRNPFFEITYNEENLGLIGNIYNLLKLTNSSYIWFVGDDDVLLPRVICKVISIIQSKSVDYIFLNFNTFYDTIDNVQSTLTLPNTVGFIDNNRALALDFFKANGTACMFMSAGIHKTENIRIVADLNRKPLITDPLLFYFFSANKSIYIEEQVYVLDRLSGISWKKDAVNVFSWKVPNTLIELFEFDIYTKNDIKDVLYHYFRRDKNYLFFILKSPVCLKLKMFEMLFGKNISLTLLSVKYFFFLATKRRYINRK